MGALLGLIWLVFRLVGFALVLCVGYPLLLRLRLRVAELRSSSDVARKATKIKNKSDSDSARQEDRPPATRCVGVVVVGGDLARSPRMQYHASSMCESGRFAEVRCVGIDEGNMCAEHLTTKKQARFCLVSRTVPRGIFNKSWLLRTLYRVLAFIGGFTVALLRATVPLASAGGEETRVVLVLQTPPAVPFIMIAQLVSMMRRTQAVFAGLVGRPRSRVSIVIDFHNFGWTLLDVDRRPKPVVALYWALETFFGVGDAHFTVADAMKGRLSGKDRQTPSALVLPKSSVTVLRDCAPAFFRPLKDPQAALKRIAATEGDDLVVPEWVPERRASHLALISATSWTADDDYTLVVDALKAIDKQLAAAKSGRVWLLVTGKGETRARFEAQIQAAQLSDRVVVSTHYFQSFVTYATAMSLFDAGLCVHRSSSGLDLPMKCVDMFGCGLPVVALDYPALPELVTDATGWRFDDAASLEEVLLSLLHPGTGRDDIGRRAKNVIARREVDAWAPNWNAHAIPAIDALLR